MTDPAVKKTPKKPAKAAKAATPQKSSIRKPANAAQPTLLSGGNPQIAKGYGDAPVQAYIAAMPGWKSDVGRRLDALIARTIPDVHKAVKWNSPLYGVDGEGWFLSLPLLHKIHQGGFLPRRVAESCPSRNIQAQGCALLPHPRR